MQILHIFKTKWLESFLSILTASINRLNHLSPRALGGGSDRGDHDKLKRMCENNEDKRKSLLERRNKYLRWVSTVYVRQNGFKFSKHFKEWPNHIPKFATMIDSWSVLGFFCENELPGSSSTISPSDS